MDGLAAMDPKTQLNSFCQQYLGRNVNNRYDVIYDSGWIASKHMWQATVRLACMDGDPTFAGHSDPDRRIAEHNAAIQALAIYANEIKQLEADPLFFERIRQEQAEIDAWPAKKKKKPNPDKDPERPVAPDMPKTKLCEFVSKTLKRPLVKTDMIFKATKQANNKYVSTLQLPTMLAHVSQQLWTGIEAQTIKDSEHNVSQIVLDTLKADPVISEMHAQFKVESERKQARKAEKAATKAGKGPGKGGPVKGKGKGWKGKGWDDWGGKNGNWSSWDGDSWDSGDAWDPNVPPTPPCVLPPPPPPVRGDLLMLDSSDLSFGLGLPQDSGFDGCTGLLPQDSGFDGCTGLLPQDSGFDGCTGLLPQDGIVGGCTGELPQDGTLGGCADQPPQEPAAPAPEDAALQDLAATLDFSVPLE
eukprot:TRINITY_DN14430_c0_g1_i1.p1 TRINITY_DN14430_c0_g1~~TRINITY_DN14430_c0_g1_i1.p1  ORF type:complete len:415 (-),score=91.75 TRINITY_DN14430_c0_g1_i1:49-1293(-)